MIGSIIHIIAFSDRICNGLGKEIYMWITCKSYVNRWGKLMVSTDYGYKFWRFFVPCKKPKVS